MTALWIAILGAFSSVLVVLLTQSYAKNASLRADLKSKKQRLYSEYVKFLYGAYTGSAETSSEELISTFKKYFPDLMSYASNDVIKCAGDFMQHLYHYDQNAIDRGDKSWNINSMEYFGDLIIAIRNDLGHKKFMQLMRWHDVARLWITDIDSFVPNYERTPRATHPGPKPRIP